MDPNGFAMHAESPAHVETVFSPNGTVHQVDLRSPSGVLYGKQAHSEYGADRTYTGETYAAFASGHAGGQRVQAERPDSAMPPSALRRSMSSRVAGMGAPEETPNKLRRKVSWAGNTNDFTSRGSLRSMPSGASMDAMEAAAAAASHNMKAASCLTHLLSYFGGTPAGGAGCCAPGESSEDEVAARMRRSMSSRGQDVEDNGGVTHSHGGAAPGQPQYR